ncbi:MAG: LptF/LptG family permease [Brevinematia bacterium]
MLATVKKTLKKIFFSRLDLYFYEELIPNYVFGLLFFTLLMLLNQLFYLIKLYTVYNVPLKQVFLLLFNLIPFLLSYTIPLSILPALLLTMGRLSSDSEIVAMRSCGISTLRIFSPGILFGIFIMFFSFFFTDNIVVKANEIYVKLNTKIVSQKPAIELKEKSFLEIGDYKISFESLSYDKNNIEILHNLSVIDLKGRKTIQADIGRIYLDPENPEHYVLKFKNGSISEVTKTKNVTETNSTEEERFFVASFKNLTLHIYMPLPEEYYSKGPDMMKVKELIAELGKTKVVKERMESFINDKERIMKEIENIKREFNIQKKELSKEEVKKKLEEVEAKVKSYRKELELVEKSIENYRRGAPTYQRMKLYEKFAMPLASLSFVILSLSLGMYTARSGRNEGLGISIILTLLFYGLKIGTENLIMKGFLPPILEWFATTLYLTAGLILMAFKLKE